MNRKAVENMERLLKKQGYLKAVEHMEGLLKKQGYLKTDDENYGLFIKDNEILISSIDVAEKFRKQHKHVMEKIKNLNCSPEFTKTNFRPSTYRDNTGRELPCFNLTRNGFTRLVMSFTGKKASIWIEKFIHQFDEMENALRSQVPVHHFHDPVFEMMQKNLIELDQTRHQVAMHEKEISGLKTDVKVLQLEQHHQSGYFSIRARLKELRISLPGDIVKAMGKEASYIARQRGIQLGKVPDERWGHINTYPEVLIDEVIGRYVKIDPQGDLLQ
jgi:Rha family phage regulatory protein